MIKIGCCGFPVKKADYYREFQLVEVQNTFYDIPRFTLYEKWRKESPETFEFTVKAWQVITHPVNSPTYRRMKEKWGNPENYGYFKPTPEVKEGWRRTKEVAEILGARIIVFQTPPSFHANLQNKENLKNFFQQIAGGENFIFALELRGKWEEEEKKEIMEELGLLHVVDPFREKSLCGEFQYFRLHGIGGYNYKYSEEDLYHLKYWCEEKETYCLFNNTFMWESALRFKKLMEGG